MKAIEAGIDNIDTSISSLSMTYGHSATETMNAIFEGHERQIDLDMAALEESSDYFKKIREKYSEFEGDMKGVDTTMLVKQVPGGMISSLETQLKSNKQEDKIDLVKNEVGEPLDQEELENMKKELEELCAENSLPDLSENEEMLLTYILFPNIALRFFQSLNF